jgi:hypothetical protein
MECRRIIGRAKHETEVLLLGKWNATIPGVEVAPCQEYVKEKIAR